MFLQLPTSFLNVEEVWVTPQVIRKIPKNFLGLFQFTRMEVTLFSL